MSRILLAWELGGNFGHLSRLLPLARLLCQHGHEPIFAVRDLATASIMIGREFPVLQAPLPPGVDKRPVVPVSHADILAEAGFGSKDTLGGMLHAWQGLIGLFGPDVIVAQFAPTAIVAARQASIPTVCPDTGFESPPQVSPFPCFRPWLKVSHERLLEKEANLLSIINAACNGNSRSLNAALRADLTLLTTLPELDHYPGRQGGRYIGPLFQVDEGEKVNWQSERDKRIFVYLRPFPELPVVLNDLKNTGAEVIAAIPGVETNVEAAFSSEYFRIIPRQGRLDALLPQADLVVSHGGHGLVSASLLQGVPSLVIPTMIEQWLTACNLEGLGAGLGITRELLRKRGCSGLLSCLLTEAAHKEQATALATKYQAYDQQKTISRLACTVERMAKK